MHQVSISCFQANLSCSLLSLLESHNGMNKKNTTSYNGMKKKKITTTGAAGLQAVLPDALLMAVAAARPSSASALVAHAKKTLKQLHREVAQQETYDALPRHVPACLCQQSEQVCISDSCVDTCLSPAVSIPAGC